MTDNSNTESTTHVVPVKYSQTQLSELLEIRKGTLSSILTELEVPFETGPRGSHLYTLPDVFRALFDQNKKASAGQEIDSSTDPDKARLTKAKADLAELELEKKRGQLVDSGLVLTTVAAEYADVRSQLITIPQSMAVELSVLNNPEEIQKQLEQKINSILLALQFDSDQKLNSLNPE